MTFCSQKFPRLWVFGTVLLLLFAQTLKAAPGTILFTDDFERASLGGNWTVNTFGNDGDAGIGTQTANSPTRSLYTRWGQVTVTSNVFDLSAIPAAELSLWFRIGQDTFSEDPERPGTEDLIIEYFSSGGTWNTLTRYIGGTTPGQIFNPVLSLPTDALHANFQFRFHQTGGDGQFACFSFAIGCDYYHMDDVVLTERAAIPPVVGGFCDDFESGLGNWTVTSTGGGIAGINSTTFNSATNNSLFTAWNPVTVVSKPMDMSAQTAVDFKVSIQHGYDDIFAPSEYPDGGENMVVEYLNNASSWVTLETFFGGGTPAQIFVRTYSLPTDALHAALQVRFRQTNGSGADWDYWHVDDMCATPPPPPGACSASFTDGLQTYNVAGNIRFDNNAFLTGSPDGILDAGSITNAAGNSCLSQAADCIASTTAANSLNPGAYQTQSGGNNLNIVNNGTATIGGGGISNYNNISIGNSGTLNASAGVTLYKINSLDARNDAILNFTPGDYWIDNFRLHRRVILNVIGAGTVRIYSRTQLRIDQDSVINGGAGGNASQLFFYSYGNISFRDRASLAAVVYAQGLIDARNDVAVKGAMTANNIRLRLRANVTYDASAVATLDFGGICTPPANIDHFEISHDGVGLTCSAETITVKACADAACSSVATIDTTVTLSATGQPSVWTPASILIPANSTAGVQIDLNHTTPEVITLSAAGAPSAINTEVCNPSCNLEFFDSGFIFAVPAQTSCQTSALVTLSAVRKSLTSQQCVPGFSNKSATLKFWTNYLNPATGAGNQTTLTYNATNYLLATVKGTDVPVTFDANGQITFSVNYPDAGEQTLNASFDGTVAPDVGLAMVGADNFVTVPAKLIVSSPDANASCASNDANCSVFNKAGAPFNLSIAGACADNSVTPNFQLNNIPLTLATVAPVSGNPVALGVTSFNITAADSGAHIISNQTVSEVGVFNFTATPAAGSYLGQTVPSATSASIGRFTPDRFLVTSNTPQLQNATCNFTYQDQPFGFVTPGLEPEITMTAVNLLGNPTLNYGNSFWKLATTFPNRSYIDQVVPAVLANLTSTQGVVALTGQNDFVDGAGLFSLTGDLLTYNKAAAIPAALDAPFNALIRLDIPSGDFTDSDGVTSGNWSSADFGSTNIRWGRWFLENAFGSETQPLTVLGQVQSFDGVQFVLNTDDSCSAPTTTLSNYLGNLLAIDTTLTTPATTLNGLLALTFSAPGVGNDGSVEVSTTLPGWLQYDYNGDTLPDNALSTATFGVYSGKRPVIYWRQTFGN